MRVAVALRSGGGRCPWRSVRSLSLSLSLLSLTLSPSLPPLSLQSGINANLGQTTYSKESFVITDPFAKKEDETKKLIDQLANFRKIKAKREAMREESEGGLAGMLAADGAPGGAWGGSQSGAQMMGGKAVKRYVPIHERKGAKAMDMTAITDFRDEGHTLRVTNLSMDTKEADLAELFRRFGKTNRIYLAKDRITLESRGFAFVTCVFYVVFVWFRAFLSLLSLFLSLPLSFIFSPTLNFFSAQHTASSRRRTAKRRWHDWTGGVLARGTSVRSDEVAQACGAQRRRRPGRGGALPRGV